MISLIARYRVKPESLSKVKRAILDFVDVVRKREPGTLVYEAFQEKDKLSFVHFMAFKNKKSEEKHRNSEHVKKFVGVLYPNCNRKPKFSKVDLVRSNRI